MVYYNSKTNTIVHIPHQPVVGYPDWELIDCECCNGIEWGGKSPHTCKRCGGTGYVYRHLESGVIAKHPGGKLQIRNSYGEIDE